MRKVSLKQKLSFGFANTGTNMLSNVISGSFLVYYTDYLFLKPVYYGIAFMIFAIWNAINDPIFGYISDKTIPTSKGKRLPFIWKSIPFYFLGFYLMVFNQPSWTQFGIFIILLAGLLVYDTGLAMYTINASALATTITNEPSERASISMISSYVNIIPLAIVGLVPVFFFTENAPHPTILVMFLLIGAIGLIFSLIGIKGIKEPLEIYEEIQIEEPMGIKQSLVEALKSRSFVIYSVFSFMLAGVVNSYYGFITTYFKWVQEFPGLIATIASAGGGLLLNLSYPVTLRVSKRIGGRRTFFIYLSLTGIGYLGLFFAKGVVPVLICYACVMVGFGSFWLFNNAMLGDIVDEDEVKNGERREGIFFGMNQLIITPAISVVIFLFTLITTMYGYDGEALTQTPNAILGIRIGMCLMPAAFIILALLMMYFYPLHGKRYKEMKESLKKRHEEKNNE